MKKSILVFLSLFYIINIFVDNLSADSKFQFGYDYSIFRGSNDKAIVEIYYSFYQKGLMYKFEDGKFIAAGQIDLSIFKYGTSDTIFSNSYKVPSTVNDTSGSNLEQKIVGQLTFQIPYGEYTLRIIGRDYYETSKSDSIQQEIKIISFDETPQISDIELSTSIFKSSDTESIFYKNTLEVIPNPSSLFGNNVTELYFYYEIYGLIKEKISDEFSIISIITDRNKTELYRKTKNIKPVSQSIAEYGFFKVDSLPTGSYFLIINLSDSLNNIDILKERKFYIYNPDIEVYTNLTEDDKFLRSEYANMRKELIDEDFEKSLYLRTTTETEDYEKLTSLEQKRKFMYNFWKNRDDNPSTPQNEFKLKYLLRILEANKLFNESFKEGWRTDRGRIYIVYGKPDSREVFPFEPNTKGYEIWTYDALEGGTMCVFIELLSVGSGDYELVHSTLKNELRNENWKSIVGKEE